MAKTPGGFVSLTSLKGGAPDPRTALAQIRKIYFATTRQTIDNDFAHAIALLQSLPDEEAREKASVYMEGIAQMQREWEAASRRKTKGGAKKPSPPRKPRSHE